MSSCGRPGLLPEQTPAHSGDPASSKALLPFFSQPEGLEGGLLPSQTTCYFQLHQLLPGLMGTQTAPRLAAPFHQLLPTAPRQRGRALRNLCPVFLLIPFSRRATESSLGFKSPTCPSDACSAAAVAQSLGTSHTLVCTALPGEMLSQGLPLKLQTCPQEDAKPTR